jgi:hypothetical protein
MPETPRDLRSTRIKAWLQRQRRVALLALCLIASLAGGRWITTAIANALHNGADLPAFHDTSQPFG